MHAVAFSSRNPLACASRPYLTFMQSAMQRHQNHVQVDANTTWRSQFVHLKEAFPKNILATPQREEIQLTARLWRATPAEFNVAPPPDDADDA